MNILMNYGGLSDGDLQLVRDLMKIREDEEPARPSAAKQEELARVKEQSQSTDPLPFRSFSLQYQDLKELDKETEGEMSEQEDMDDEESIERRNDTYDNEDEDEDMEMLRRVEEGTDPSEHVHGFKAEIFGHEDVSGQEPGVKLGYVRTLAVDAMDVDFFGHSLWEACDASCQELTDVYLALFGHPDYPPPWYEYAGVTGEERICYIDSIFLEPQFRRRGLSLLVLDTVVKTFEKAGANNIVLHAGVMTDVKHFTADGTEDQHDAVERLEKHFGKLGFHTVEPRFEGRLGLLLMTFPTCLPTWMRKDIKEILPDLGPITTSELPKT